MLNLGVNNSFADNGSNNEKIAFFDKLSNKIQSQDMSVVKKYFDNQYDSTAGFYTGHKLNISDDEAHDIVVPSTFIAKSKRMMQYRAMADFNEVGDAIDEIADAHITSHDDGKFAKAVIKSGSGLNDNAIKEVEKNSERYLALFDFENNIYEYARKLVIEGQLCWENIVPDNVDDMELGVVDVRFMPTETYEFAFDVTSKEKTGIVVNQDTSASTKAVMETLSNPSGIGGNSGYDNARNLNCSELIANQKGVYLPYSQITYIDSGIYNQTGLMVYPPLERARRAYNQLQLVEDSFLIYRIARAPMRHVFNVGVGGLSRSKAEQRVKQLSQSFSSKKMYDPATGTIVGHYDPYSMMENIWLAQGKDGNGVKIESVGGDAEWKNFDDLYYFLRKLYRALKVPSSRFIPGESGTVKEVKTTDGIDYEEYKFAKFIVRLLTCFKRGLKEGLINHLKMVGCWDTNDLNPSMIDIDIKAPSEYEIYKKQKAVEMRTDMYEKMAKIEGVSQRMSMKKYLGFNDEEIKENKKYYEREMLEKAKFETRLEEIKKGKSKGIEEEFGDADMGGLDAGEVDELDDEIPPTEDVVEAEETIEEVE